MAISLIFLPFWRHKGAEKMASYNQSLNKQQTELRRLLASPSQHDQAIALFLRYHAMLHSARVAPTESWSYEDTILNDMTEEQIRRIPPNCNHSIAWLLWHMTRCEDITMNLLVAGRPQVLQRDNWLERLRITVQDTGNAMSRAEITQFSAVIDIDALRAYRVAVGRRTREIVSQLGPEELQQKVAPGRLQQVWAEGALVEAARGIADYWGKRTKAGLLLMPATRHNIVHLNEALLLKRRTSSGRDERRTG
jgi:hypothetical protein